MITAHRLGLPLVASAFMLLLQALAPAVSAGAANEPETLADQRQTIERDLAQLGQRLEHLRGDDRGRRDSIADAEVFAKGIAWALRYDTALSPADLGLLRKALGRCESRVAALQGGDAPWEGRKGKLVRGFVSAIDGSVQPYAVVVPTGYDGKKPMRLDVVLHGSSQPVGMSELRFINRFDEGDELAPNAPNQDFIELHPLARVENGYRWAGETDVFEAIEAVCRNYSIDRDRVVLRGMSMGASGTWHLGLKRPDIFVALGPYCGYVDTHEFSKTPMPRFVEVGALPSYQESMLHMLDSVDYAANAGVVPAIACMGEKDPFFQAHVIMGRAMEKEGLKFINLISPGTGHVIDPVTHAEQMRRLGILAERGLNHAPPHLRFVTWTLKYSRCHWLQVLGLDEHYRRAEIEGRLRADGAVEVEEPKNITRFAILPPVASKLRSLRVGERELAIPEHGAGRRSSLVLERRTTGWTCLGEADGSRLDGKRPGLQGPIDDAFTAPFLCVRGTGTAWDPAVQAWADASLRRFAHEWHRYFHGDLPVKDDTKVTEEDARRYHLILFGDPGSNAWIARLLPDLKVRWTRTDCALGDLRVPSKGHALILIQPNPVAPGRYVVLNSGHTFHEPELSTLNYLLFPRLGDWAVVKVPVSVPDPPTRPLGEQVLGTGFFDERWEVAGPGATRAKSTR